MSLVVKIFLSICLLALANCFSPPTEQAYDPLSLASSKNASRRVAHYPFYIQAFPYDFNCNGNLSFIQNPPPTSGRGAYSSMANVSSFLTVPTDNTSITCVYGSWYQPICYSGDLPKCFSMSSGTNIVEVTMNDSSHAFNFHNITFYYSSSDHYYALTPSTTYAYLEDGLEKPKNDSYAVYKTYLYSRSNTTYRFEYLDAELVHDKRRCGSASSLKHKRFENERTFMDYFYKQKIYTERESNLHFVPPKLKPISNRKEVSKIRLNSTSNFVGRDYPICVDTSSSTSPRMKNGLLYICLAFGLIAL
ncbi:uncharacterized protein SOCG_01878 [Schizosaccharomyces octosporus yFS286]|uniref:Uncharacterized protein n=1 Tax=Schizosaccharomyces octosporus (strain yFS286) TaxID=483514 RepID=S9PW18_SCHOY|nr:uncharacterized protein SOCG_01878 [Schizosaccharomyces octosporus yFS286]EPX71663.1 hypothetical protein SOCG_01878 [Schizosaccharomyces octosporus yFS286]